MTISADPEGPGFLAHVTYQIDPGINYTVERIRLAGNVTTKDKLLYRELKIKEGQPLYWQLVEDSRRQLLATSPAAEATVPPNCAVVVASG